MNWKQALKYMSEGGSICRKSWLVNDYLYADKGVIKDDGGNVYKGKGLEQGEWLKWTRLED